MSNRTIPLLQQNTIYQTVDGRFLEYISTSGKRAGEARGFRFYDPASGEMVVIASDALLSTLALDTRETA